MTMFQWLIMQISLHNAKRKAIKLGSYPVIKWIDPPNGYLFGFPLPYYTIFGDEPKDMEKWLIGKGYPKGIIADYQGTFKDKVKFFELCM